MTDIKTDPYVLICLFHQEDVTKVQETRLQAETRREKHSNSDTGALFPIKFAKSDRKKRTKAVTRISFLMCPNKSPSFWWLIQFYKNEGQKVKTLRWPEDSVSLCLQVHSMPTWIYSDHITKITTCPKGYSICWQCFCCVTHPMRGLLVNGLLGVFWIYYEGVCSVYLVYISQRCGVCAWLVCAWLVCVCS